MDGQGCGSAESVSWTRTRNPSGLLFPLHEPSFWLNLVLGVCFRSRFWDESHFSLERRLSFPVEEEITWIKERSGTGT